MENKLDQVAVRLVEQPPLLCETPMNSPQKAVEVMSEFLAGMDREFFCIVNLQSDYKPINMNIISVGSLDQTIAHPREILKSAILSNANAMMLIHNHPSGNLTPSKEDIRVTARMQEVGELMGIPLLDHIITGRGKEYFSFKDKGQFPLSHLFFSNDLKDLNLPGIQNISENHEPYLFGTEKTAVQTATIPLPVAGKDLNSITQSLEKGVADLFSGERYKTYLQTMAKFHRYSFNNTVLIAMQRPDATLVTGYRNWQNMGRQVKKGEKGITILAPAPIKQKRLQEMRDKHQNPILDESGYPKKEEVEIVIPRFKAITVFDIGQTEGEPIETLSPELLTASVEQFDLFFRAIQEVSPVPIRFDRIQGGANGYYHTVDKEIVIKEGLSESQTLKTAIHETAHAKLHDREKMQRLGEKKDQLTKEVEAESVAYCVCAAFGLDTSEYSFPYIAGWSSNQDMQELKTSMDVIRQTAGEMIEQLKEKLEFFLEEQKETLLSAVEAAGYRFDEQESSSGHLYFLPDGMHEIKGTLIAQSWDEVKEWMEELISKHTMESERVERVLYPERFEKSMEEMMFTEQGNRFAIYQINETDKNRDLMFRGMSELKERNLEIQAENYQCVYSGDLLLSDTLEDLYAMFNDNPPADFKAHSMSVSDVVVLNQNGNIQAYYVDSLGFSELSDFAEQRRDILGIPSDLEYMDVLDDSACISFYAAECSEFPVLGEVYHDLSLKEALEAYEKIPENRMHGIKSVGFNLQAGSEYDGMMDLLIGDQVQREILDSIPFYKDNQLVQTALKRVEEYLEQRDHNMEKTEKKEPKQDKQRIPKKRGEMSL